MAKFILIDTASNTCVDQFDGDTPFPVHPSLVWLDVTARDPQPQPGWWVEPDGEDFIFIDPTPPEPPFDPVAHLAAYRYEKENGGTVVGGLPVLTDQFTRTNLTGARIRATEDPSYTVQWKTPVGFTTLDATTIIAVADAVADHVQKCFGAEAAVLGIIGTLETAEAVEAAFDESYNAT